MSCLRAALAGITAAMLLTAPDAVRTAAPVNVLLITIDTLRADRVGAYGYKSASTPTLDALAAAGVRFSDAVAHVPLTYPSHVSVMTGRYPAIWGIRLNGSPVLAGDATTLAERLRAAGYATGAFVGSAVLDAGYGLDQGFQTYDDDVTPPRRSGDRRDTVAISEMQRPADAVVTAAEQWLRQQKGPWFAWVHLFDPHLPYAAPPAYQKAAPGRPYDAEVAFADAMLGRLLKSIDRANTMVIATSDHGESLGEHGEADHGFFIYDATLKVPLVVAGPGLAPRVVREQVRLVDIMPTTLALAGVQPGTPIDGVNLMPLLNGGSRAEVPPSPAESWYPRLHFGWSELRGLRVGEFMYIAAPKPELYDLRTDPAQRVNVVDRRGPVAGRLASELAAMSPKPSGPLASAPQPDPETVRRLQALGYVGSFAPVTASAGEDPKDHIKTYRAYRDLLNSALALLDGGRPAAAIPALQKLVKLNVRAFEAHLYLGNAYAATGRTEEALGEYEAALQLNPEVTMPRIEMAKVLLAKGNADGAVDNMRAVIEKEPRSAYAWYTLGVIHTKAARHADAMRAFSEAARLNPKDGRAASSLATAAMRAGQTAIAREQLERMIALGYDVAPANYNLGLLAQREGDTTRARAFFQAALAADPTFAPARQALAKLK